MDDRIEIRIVAEGNNEKGDILTRLAGDLFHSLGFVDLKYNVARTGRELDITGSHEFEYKLLRAECKALGVRVGGDQINKFAGALQAEQNRAKPQPVAGYFVSLSGFKDSAKEQEEEFVRRRIAMVGPVELCSRLQAGGVIVERDKAIDRARHVAAGIVPNDAAIQEVEVIGSRLGWAWGIYYGIGPEAISHVCFIHADGHPLSYAAGAALTRDDSCAVIGAPAPADAVVEAVEAYKRYLCREFGHITLEGLQADQEIGSRSFNLESLYVPAHLADAPARDAEAEESFDDDDDDDDNFDFGFDPYIQAPVNRVTLGEALAANSRLAILGPPGSGKSTLVKRLAVAYAEPERRVRVADGLPDLHCLPVVVRCRQLRDAGQSVVETLFEQINRAERPELREPFGLAVASALRDGTLLLLLDGMDEIRTAGDKIAFAKQLRIFLSVYPAVRVVVTSREAGFRPIAGAVTEVCTPFYVADLSDDDIERLSVAWHQVTVGRSAEVEREARRLSFDICNIDRVRRLASNPLLLTTLLLVRRGVGQLPRRRSILYGKAVEVLLMTWNVEGHTPVDPDEALPQLGFVAHWMMTNGKQTITDAELRRLLRQARSEMPDLLMHAKLGISEMIAKIEERSSLLTLAGHEVYDGTLQPFYEFKHLTFQEYLCARAITEKWLPQALSASSTLDLIKPRLGDSTWREVVVLTAALQGRSASAVVAEVIKKIRAVPRPARNTADDINRYDDRIFPLVSNLVGCLADDVPVAPELLDKALYHVVYMFEGDVALEVLGSRYEDSLRAYVQSRASIAKDLDPAVTLFVSLVGSEFVDQPVHKILDACAVELRRSDESGVLRGFALLVFACLYDGNALEPEVPRPIGKVHLSKWRKSFEIAASVLCADRLSPASKVLAIWAIGWRGLSVQSPELVNRLQQWLLRAWVNEPDRSSGIPWALMTTRIVGRWDIGDLNIEPTALDSFFSYQLEVRGESPRVMCAIYLCSYYLDLPWRRERIAEVMQGDQELGDARNRTEVEFAVRMFEALGEPVPDPFKKRSKLLRSRDR